MQPSLGMIVLAIVDPKTNNGADVAPAVVTRVWSDTMVNVRVLLDQDATVWHTSVSLYEDRATADEALDKVRETMLAAGNDPAAIVPRAVFWPPRV